MAKLTPSRAAQTVLCSEFTFEFADTMLDVNGVLSDFKTVGSNVFEPINLPPAPSSSAARSSPKPL